MDANERFGSDNQSNHGQGSATAWPDGTLISESERHAPVDARELTHDLRRYRREERWAHRRRALAQMAEQVRVHDVHDWVSTQLDDIATRGATARERG